MVKIAGFGRNGMTELLAVEMGTPTTQEVQNICQTQSSLQHVDSHGRGLWAVTF